MDYISSKTAENLVSRSLCFFSKPEARDKILLLTMQTTLALIVIFFAIFTQSLAGFGSGLVSMAFLPGVLGVRTAVPLVALTTASLEFFLLIR